MKPFGSKRKGGLVRPIRLILLGIALVAGAKNWDCGSAFAADKRAEVQKFCPVFTDRIVGPESRFVRYRGIRVYFSSDLAARKWMRDPVSYLDKEILPQLGDLILAERLIRQHYCPVYPKRKVSLKDPTVLYEGKRVYLFDREAVKIWNSAPEKFLNLEILPQLADEEKPPEEEESPMP